MPKKINANILPQRIMRKMLKLNESYMMSTYRGMHQAEYRVHVVLARRTRVVFFEL